MATIGQALTTPEAGWQRIDDGNAKIVYAGASVDTFASHSGGGMRYGNGMVAKFRFYGTKLRLIIYNNYGAGYSENVGLTIDGVNYTYSGIPIAGSITYQVVAFEAIGLTEGIHTVVINPDASKTINLDAIDIDATGYMVTQMGQQLTGPEVGWKRYDDSSPVFKYEGGPWQTNSSTASVGYNETMHHIDSVSGSIKFSFIGTRLRIIAPTGAATGRSTKVAVNIDGVEEYFSLQATTEQQQILVYEKIGLLSGMHSVTIKDAETGMKNIYFDALDVDASGRVLHPDEITDTRDLVVGKKIRCHYVATSGVAGSFSGLGQETSDFIPATSTATPNGDFYFIMVDDWNGKKKLIADRNIQHSISWDVLNSSGIASGSGVPLTIPGLETNIKLAVRLLTGGVSSADQDNEWDQYIVSSNLNGAITPGDNNIWNWNGIGSWTSSTSNAAGNRATRGNTELNKYWTNVASSTVGVGSALRPVFIIENLPAIKYLFEDNGDIKKYAKTANAYSLSFNGSNNYVTFGSPILPVGAKSIRFKMKKNAATTGWNNILDTRGSSSNGFVLFLYPSTDPNAGKLCFAFRQNGSNSVGSIASSSSVCDGKWHDVLITYDGNLTLKMYIDDMSNPVATTTMTTPETNIGGFNMVMGKAAAASGDYYTGLLDSMKLYSDATQTNLVAHYRFEEGSGTTIIDQTGSYNGTNNGATWSTDTMGIEYQWLVLGAAPATDIMFKNNGMEDLSTIDDVAIQSLTSDIPKLLLWTDALVDKAVALTAVPENQLVMPAGDIEIPPQGLDHFALTANGAKVIASGDEGTTWKTWSGSSWTEVNATDLAIVQSDGMTPDIFNAITTGQWKELITNGKVRFAYYLEQESSADNVNVDAISIVTGSLADQTPSLDSIKVTFDEVTIEGRMKDLEKINAINIAKLNFKSNALLMSAKYNLFDMIVDTFDTDTGVDASGTTATYDTINKEFYGAGTITMPAETIPQNHKYLFIVAEGSEDVSLQYSLDGGASWKAIATNMLTDISAEAGTTLKIKANLPSSSSNLTAVSYSWA